MVTERSCDAESHRRSSTDEGGSRSCARTAARVCSSTSAPLRTGIATLTSLVIACPSEAGLGATSCLLVIARVRPSARSHKYPRPRGGSGAFLACSPKSSSIARRRSASWCVAARSLCSWATRHDQAIAMMRAMRQPSARQERTLRPLVEPSGVRHVRDRLVAVKLRDRLLGRGEQR